MKSTARSACAWLWRKSAPVVVDRCGGGVDAGGLEDLPDRGGGDLDAGGGEFPVDAPVSPGRTFAGHAQDEGADGAHRRRPSTAFRFRDVRVPLADQVAVQRGTVSGRTSSRSRRGTDRGKGCRSAARNARSAEVNVTDLEPRWRCNTPICGAGRDCRASLSRLVIGSRRSITKALVTVRYASRSSTPSSCRLSYPALPVGGTASDRVHADQHHT